MPRKKSVVTPTELPPVAVTSSLPRLNKQAHPHGLNLPGYASIVRYPYATDLGDRQKKKKERSANNEGLEAQSSRLLGKASQNEIVTEIGKPRRKKKKALPASRLKTKPHYDTHGFWVPVGNPALNSDEEDASSVLSQGQLARGLRGRRRKNKKSLQQILSQRRAEVASQSVDGLRGRD